MHHIYRGVELVGNEGLLRGPRRILADHESNRPVCIDVIGTVLSVIFQNKNSSVVPVRAVGDRFDDATEGKIVIRNRGGGFGTTRPGTAGMVVGQVEQDKIR